MNYPVRTLSQLRPLLQGFRKQAGLTQAAMAEKLGITQQSYAALEANPGVAGFDRVFKVLRLLNVDISLGVATELAAVPDETPDQAAPVVSQPPADRRTQPRKAGGSKPKALAPVIPPSGKRGGW